MSFSFFYSQSLMVDRSLALSFHGSNYPSHVNVHKNIFGASCRTRLKTVIPIPSSSTRLPNDESGNLAALKKDPAISRSSTICGSANSLFSQPNTVGIIGGVSVTSTLKFMRKLVEWSSEGGKNSLPFLMCSDPALNNELRSYERSFVPSLRSKIERSGLDMDMDPISISQNLRSKRIFLEKAGARCIVMPCHLSHSWYEEVLEGCSVPFLHMGECLASELKEAKLKPLEAGSTLRIGVLATDTALSAGVYQEKLQNKGFEVVLLDKATMEHTYAPAIEALDRGDIEGAQTLVRIALQALLLRGVNTVILASDDMRDLLPRNDPLLKKCIDPMDALVRSTIDWAYKVEQTTYMTPPLYEWL